MKKYSFVLLLLTLITLTNLSTPSAQSPVQSGSPRTLADKTFIAEPIILKTGNATLYGTVQLPQARLPVPVVLIISGSGPSDRDGNSAMLPGANNSLKLLAEGLAAQGIASVRYDKRGIGETGKAMLVAAEKAKSLPREEDARFEFFIDDAVAWGKQLLADPRFSSLIVLGHSEGSLVGMVAAQRMGANAYVSVAGAGRPIQQLILEQVQAQLPPALLKATEDILAQLVIGKTVDPIPPELNVLFRPSVQPYMISWLRYDPTKEIVKLHIPVLITQGTTDAQTSLQDSKALAAANPAATLLLIDGMNHVLKAVSEREKQIASYSDPTLPVASELIDGIASFVAKAEKQRSSR